jgi:hypothetical protein
MNFTIKVYNIWTYFHFWSAADKVGLNKCRFVRVPRKCSHIEHLSFIFICILAIVLTSESKKNFMHFLYICRLF